MGIKRYVIPSNWYSNKIILFLERRPGNFESVSIKDNHMISRIYEDNIMDSQLFDSQRYVEIYSKMLKHGDYGYFGYVNNYCQARCWGRVHPNDYLIYGANMQMHHEGLYIHYVKTAENARRLGLGRECLSSLIADNNNRHLYVAIDLMNEPSILLHKGLGFKETALIIVSMRAMKESTNIHWLY